MKQKYEVRSSTASAAFMRHVISVASKLGPSQDEVLSSAGLAGYSFSDPLARVSLHRMRALFACSAQRTRSPHFGLLVGAEVRPSTYGGPGYAAMTASTLGDAISVMMRFDRLFIDSPSAATLLTMADDVATLESCRTNEIEPYCVHQVDAVLAGWVAFGRWLTKGGLQLQRVELSRQAPASVSLYEEFFGCDVLFGRKRSALSFLASHLHLPVHGADSAMHGAMMLQAEQQFDRAYAPVSMKNQLRHVLAERLQYGEAHLPTLAMHLQVTPRTLQRRLASEGETFSSVLDDVRIDIARRYLANSSMSVQDVGSMVGFSRASAFSHSFRSGCGMSPSDFRRHLTSGERSTRYAPER